jgi:hypothetical protein
VHALVPLVRRELCLGLYHQQYGIFRLTLARSTKVWTKELSEWTIGSCPMSEMPNFETETRFENELVEKRI